MDQSQLSIIARRLQDATSVLAVVHTHADPDSVGSALALAASLDVDVQIGVPGSVKANARPLLELAEDSIVADPDPSEYDVIVVLDAPTADRVSPIDVTTDSEALIVVDHHSSGDLATHADIALIDTDADATAVLVYRVLSEIWSAPSPPAAVGLAAGILDDTDFLSAGGEEAASATVELLGHVGPHSEMVVDLIGEEPPFSKRAATATAVARANGYKAAQTLLLLTECGSDQAAAANTLLDAGADIALVVSDRGDEVWVVGRLAPSVDDIHLPDDLFDPLVAEFDGDGGGHADGGTAKLPTSDVESVKAACKRCVEKATGMTFGSLQ